MQRAITLLGEAEKGRFSHPYYIQDLVQLFAHLGHPPKESSWHLFCYTNASLS